MIACRNCNAKLAEIVQGRALIACPKCRSLNLIVAQGNVRVEVVGTPNGATKP